MKGHTATISLVAALAIAACATRAPSNAGSETSARAPALSEVVPMPGPDRGREAAAVRENAECERCHADVAREWSASLHHTSDTEPAYRVSFEIEPLPFCRGCHAPEADARAEEAADVRDLGVGCVTCHVTTPGTVLAAPREGEGRPSPHRVVRDARFAGAGACAGCHEFAFPNREVRAREDLMQGTIAEHAESPARDRACAACHMPNDGAGRRSHRFTTSRDASSVAKAVNVVAERVDATHVRVTFTPRELGHAFPTGDLFRRVEVAAWDPKRPADRSTRYLARHFGSEAAGMGRKLVSDDRVTGAGAEVILDVGGTDANDPIRWSVTYQRVSHPNGIDERDASLEGELELAAGALEPVPIVRSER